MVAVLVLAFAAGVAFFMGGGDPENTDGTVDQLPTDQPVGIADAEQRLADAKTLPHAVRVGPHRLAQEMRQPHQLERARHLGARGADRDAQ